MELFTDEILEVIALESGFESLDEYKAYWNIDDTWTDQDIYNIIPDNLLYYLDEFGIHASWMNREVWPD